MRHAWMIGAALLMLGLVATVAPRTAVADAGSGSAGKELFVTQKCQTCHALSTAGIEAKTTKGPMAGPDLAGIGASYDAEWIAKYVKGEETIDGKKHKKPYKGSDEDLQAIIGWMLAQPAP